MFSLCTTIYILMAANACDLDSTFHENACDSTGAAQAEWGWALHGHLLSKGVDD